MSPCTYLVILGVSILVLWTIGYWSLIDKRGWRSLTMLLVLLAACDVAAWAGGSLYPYATGRAKYELRDNPDGTRTWQRIEVTK